MQIPLRLLTRLLNMGTHPTGIHQIVPPRRETYQVQSTHGAHHRRARQSARLRHHQRYGRGELSLRAQEITFEASGAGANQRNYARGEFYRRLPGRVHRRGGVARTREQLSVLPPHARRQKVGGGWIYETPPRMTMARMQKNYKLPVKTSLMSLRPMTPKDVPKAHKLVMKYLEKFKLSVVFSEEEFAHWLLPRKGVVSSFVNVRTKTMKQEEEGGGGGDGEEDGDDDDEEEVTDFCSYYHLHSSVLGNPDHNTMHVAYSFYNVATSVDLTELMRDCLILAKNEGHDVFNALNLMENERFLADLKFGMGDGNLQYYVYNWLCPTMSHGDVALVLL